MKLFELFEQSNILVAYHGTLQRFQYDNFKHSVHFGTIIAAVQRIEELLISNPSSYAIGTGDGKNPVIYKVQLNIHNPFQIQDHWQESNWSQIKKELKKLNGLTDDNILAIETNYNYSVSEWAEDNGYDGLAYVNTWEDPGSTSLITFSNKQIKILDVLDYFDVIAQHPDFLKNLTLDNNV